MRHASSISSQMPGSLLLTFLRLSPHPVLDIVVDDEVELFVSEAVMLCQDPVDFVDDGFANY